MSPSYFIGLPAGTQEFSNGKSASAPDAYVTPGAFPSLKEVALQFIAVQRQAPGYMGPVSGGSPQIADLTADPASSDHGLVGNSIQHSRLGWRDARAGGALHRLVEFRRCLRPFRIGWDRRPRVAFAEIASVSVSKLAEAFESLVIQGRRLASRS